MDVDNISVVNSNGQMNPVDQVNSVGQMNQDNSVGHQDNSVSHSDSIGHGSGHDSVQDSSSSLHDSVHSVHDHVHDVMNHDRDDLVQIRLAELEKKLIDQADEIVCLRSTLADVLRRVTQLEGRAHVTTTSNHVNNLNNLNNNNGYNNKGINSYSSPHRITTSMYSTGRSLYRSDLTMHNGNHSITTTTPPSVPSHRQNRLNHYQSNNSLHSEGGHSSNSSPVPSASPSPLSSSYAHNNNNNNHSRSSITNANSSLNSTSNSSLSRHSHSHTSHTPIHTPTTRNHASNLMSMRKWSASQEFKGNLNDFGNRRAMSGSLFNLHVTRPTSAASVIHIRHGTKEATFNPDDGIIRMHLRGRPLIFNIPTELLQNYTLNKVNSPPSQRLKLEWVYGYRGRDCRHNLYLLPTGEIIYFIAAVVVLYNVEDQIQRHYLGHTDDIKCLTIHPNRLLIATGQVAGLDRRERRPHVRIWDSVSLNTLVVLGQQGEFDRGICCLAFSKLDGGNLLCIVDESNEHTISLWEWQRVDKGHKITETKTTSDPVLAIEFHPMDRYSMVTIGKGHIHFWDIEGGTLAKKVGIFEKQDKPKYVQCMCFTDLGDLLTGDSNGSIMFWPRGSNRTAKIIHNAHEFGVFSICVLKDGTVMTGGGKDRRVVEWDSGLNKTGREARLPEQFGGVRTLTQGKGSMLLIGTTKNCILQGTLTLNFSIVTQGHTEELWALAVHPTQNQFITAGYDKTIHLWDTMSHLVVWSKDIGESAQTACFSPDGNVLIVATTTGRWIVIEASTRQLISMHSDGTELIGAIKFSPDGKHLALGSHDNHIYIYQVSDNFKQFNRIGRCSGHSSFITSIDWSTEGTYIQTTSGDYELLYWNATTCRQLSNMSIARDLNWATQNCTIGFNVIGIWPENADGSDVNTCDRSNSSKLLATGDDFGKINLYSHPCNKAKCLNHSYNGHSSHVTCVRFLPDDSRIISLGGRDSSIMQWSVS